jgi:hypothetical protein
VVVSVLFLLSFLNFAYNVIIYPFYLTTPTLTFWSTIFMTVFSSPELKAQVSFSDRPLSGVHLSVHLSVYPSVNFYVFDFFSRTAGPILTRLGTNHPWVKGIQVSSKEGDSPSPRGDNSERVKIH